METGERRAENGERRLEKGDRDRAVAEPVEAEVLGLGFEKTK